MRLRVLAVVASVGFIGVTCAAYLAQWLWFKWRWFRRERTGERARLVGLKMYLVKDDDDGDKKPPPPH